MRLRHLLCFCVLSMLVFQCFAQKLDKPVGLEQDLVLTQQEQVDLAGRAIDGSSDAANKLSLYYSNVRMNLEEGLRWTIIGAENGDPVSQYNAYVQLMARAAPDEKRRALFWLQKSASQGFPRAIDALRSLKQIKSK